MKKGIVIILTLTIVLLMTVAAYASDPSCISEFQVASGSNAIDQLEESGYNVIYQNLNPAGGSKVYLGYTLGGPAVTGLMTSPEYQNSIESDGVTYTPVSSISLNSGSSGSPLYLYFTTDAAAGDGIVSLTFVRETFGEEYGPLDYLNDGSIPARNEDGTPADFENGVSGYNLYCLMVRESVCLPYVSELKTVDVFSGEDLFSKLTVSGCNYYEEQPLASDYGVTTYLCYNRTADASKAIRQAFAANAEESGECDFVSAGSFQSDGREFTLWYTTDESAGEPAAEISCGKRMADVFTRGDWAKAFFEGGATGARTQLYNEAAYEELTASEELYDQYPVLAYTVGEDGAEAGETGLYLIRSARGAEPYEPTFALAKAPSEPEGEPEEEPKEEPEEEPEEAPGETLIEVGEAEEPAFDDRSEDVGGSVYETDGTLRDTEAEGIEKNETEEAAETGEDVNAGSAIGVGSMIAIAVMIFIAAVVVFLFVMLRNRKPEEQEKW